MRFHWLCVVAAIGIGCGRVSEQHCADCSGGDDAGDDGGVPGGGSDDGGPSKGCVFATGVAAAGPLYAYEIGANAQWMLTREDDEYARLWENTGAGWHGRSLGVGCLHGVMAVSPGGSLSVACLVRGNAPQTYDLKVFAISGQQMSSSLVWAAESTNRGSWNAVPLSIVFDALGRPNVLWKGALNGLSPDVFELFGISRDESAGWTLVTSYNSNRPNLTTRLVAFGAELAIAYHDTWDNTFVLARASTMLTTIARLDAPKGLDSSGFASAFDLVVADDGALHLAIADTTPVTGGTVTYYRKLGAGPFLASRVDSAVGAGTVSLTLTGNDTPLVSYHAAVTSAIRLARKTGPTTWKTDDLDHGGVGSRSVVRLDGDGHLHVAYQDDLTGQVNVLDEKCAP